MKHKDHFYKKKLKEAYKQLKQAYSELRESHVEMIFNLALMAELRDSDTGGHLVRIADYSAAIAEGLGLPRKEVETIRYASAMHDIGKIMLPDSILKKRGSLTPQEKDLVHRHARVGADIFRDPRSRMMKACRDIALTHHERFDGTGYPQGLKGEEIPLYGRIVALADCFDAYATKRSYKKAFSFERSVSMIVERAGTHFDPAVVRAFVKNKNKIKKIWDANQDISHFLKDMDAEALERTP
jgi:HD-GYP domain-containing protein (c-di-GMP phosphodiesterase class II)